MNAHSAGHAGENEVLTQRRPAWVSNRECELVLMTRKLKRRAFMQDPWGGFVMVALRWVDLAEASRLIRRKILRSFWCNSRAKMSRPMQRTKDCTWSRELPQGQINH